MSSLNFGCASVTEKSKPMKIIKSKQKLVIVQIQYDFSHIHNHIQYDFSLKVSFFHYHSLPRLLLTIQRQQIDVIFSLSLLLWARIVL